MFETPLDMGTSKMIKKQQQKQNGINCINLILFKMKKDKLIEIVN